MANRAAAEQYLITAVEHGISYGKINSDGKSVTWRGSAIDFVGVAKYFTVQRIKEHQEAK
jgi:hypothetical protein